MPRNQHSAFVAAAVVEGTVAVSIAETDAARSSVAPAPAFAASSASIAEAVAELERRLSPENLPTMDW